MNCIGLKSILIYSIDAVGNVPLHLNQEVIGIFSHAVHYDILCTPRCYKFSIQHTIARIFARSLQNCQILITESKRSRRSNTALRVNLYQLPRLATECTYTPIFKFPERHRCANITCTSITDPQKRVCITPVINRRRNGLFTPYFKQEFIGIICHAVHYDILCTLWSYISTFVYAVTNIIPERLKNNQIPITESKRSRRFQTTLRVNLYQLPSLTSECTYAPIFKFPERYRCANITVTSITNRQRGYIKLFIFNGIYIIKGRVNFYLILCAHNTCCLFGCSRDTNLAYLCTIDVAVR